MNPDIKEEIKQKIDIVDLISRYITLKKAGSIYKANCPFHNENTPSFAVNQSLQIFKCFGCGKGGDVFTFLMEIEGIEFKDALIRLGEMADIDVSKYLNTYHPNKKADTYLRINEAALNFFNYVLTSTPSGKPALEYLKDKRGYTINQINELKLGYAPNSWDSLYKYLTLNKKFDEKDIEDVGLIKRSKTKYFDAFRGRITIPLINERDELVGFSGRTIVNDEPKYLNTKETPLFKKSRFLFNLNNAKMEMKRQKYVIVSEGIFDALTPYIKGVKNIIASQGTALTQDQVKLIKRYCETMILFFDNDSAGNEATVRGIEVAQNGGLMVKIATLPIGFKDPDEAAKENIDIIYKCGDEALNAFDYFFKYAEKRFNVKDAYGKSQAAKFLKPKIGRITDEVLKSHYTKKLAELLEISESAVTDDNTYSKAETPLAENPNIEFEAPQVSLLTIYLLNSDRKNFNKYYKYSVEHKLLRNDELELLSDYKKNVLALKKDRAEYIQDSPFKDKLEYSFLQSLGDFTTNTELADKILNDMTAKALNVKLKQKLSRISDKIKQAEASKDAKKLDLLQKKFNILAKKLSTKH